MELTQDCQGLDGAVKEIEETNGFKEWWFDDTLAPVAESASPEGKEKALKRYYAFSQIYYHKSFRKNDGNAEKVISELINRIEKGDEFKYCTDKNKRLKDLTLGTAYRRLAQLKIERYQAAETEQKKANQYLETDSFFLDKERYEDDDFIIMLLFLLNKAKYFRDIAETDSIRTDANYCRAITLFQEIVHKVEARLDENNYEEKEGVIARIYASARLNIARVYRLQRNHEMVEMECQKLVNSCLGSIKNQGNKGLIDDNIKMLSWCDKPEGDKNVRFQMNGSRGREDWADCLFEDYILQGLLQLGISYRDEVNFNDSQKGREYVKKAMRIFLVLATIDHIKDKEEQKDDCIGKIKQVVEELEELSFNPFNQEAEQEKYNGIADRIKAYCTNDKLGNEGSDSNESVIKNEDSKNNLAVCLKKLGYYLTAISILEDTSMKGNRFAEYNLDKCYLEFGLVEKAEDICRHCGYKEKTEGRAEQALDKEKQKENVYVYLDDFGASNRKWLFMYARYRLAKGEYAAAEEIFRYIRSSREIQWNSVELKAAFLEAQCLSKRAKNLLAIDVLNSIHDSLLKQNKGKELNQLKQYEVRVEIDRGKCLIMEDRYQEALEVYEELISYLLSDEQARKTSGQSKEAYDEGGIVKLLNDLQNAVMDSPSNLMDDWNSRKWHDVDYEHQMKVLHGLYDCYTYLDSKSQNKETGDKEKRYNKHTFAINQICEANSNTEIDFYKNIRRLNEQKIKDTKNRKGTKNIQDWKNLSDSFGKVLRKKTQDIVAYNCWVISKANYCMAIFDDNKEQFKTEFTQLLKGLVSSTTPITMKSYVELAKLILIDNVITLGSNNGEYADGQIMYSFLKLFCHVKLLENGTNQAFMNLMADQSFHSIELYTRTKILAMIVELYGNILQMKTMLRVTYDDLEKKKIKDKKDGRSEEGESIICQYTKLNTIKAILSSKEGNEPKLRMSNAARMNDAWEGFVFKELFEKVVTEEEGAMDDSTASNMKKYIDNSTIFGIEDELSSQNSDVYIASFSMNQNNFGLWSNYADHEKGCIIGFDATFFDIVDENYYSILDDEAEENALYRILYVDQAGGSGDEGDDSKKHFGILNCTDDEAQIIKSCIPEIQRMILKIEGILSDDGEQEEPSISLEAVTVIRTFIADRMNEIRFLFKSISYQYEEEMRLLRCCQKPEVDDSQSLPVPWLYINVEKPLNNLTLILGSRVEQQHVKELAVWAKNTGKVKRIIWSGLNRLK